MSVNGLGDEHDEAAECLVSLAVASEVCGACYVEVGCLLAGAWC